MKMDDKTVKTSNRRKHQAVYVAHENHDGDQNNYCPGQNFSQVSEEEFDRNTSREEWKKYAMNYITTLENGRTKKKRTYAE